MLREIRLYGELGKKYGKVHHLHVASVSEAVRALSANYKDFRQYVIDSTDKIAGYEVWGGNYNLGEEDKEEFVKHGDGVIKIIPKVIGAGNVGKIIAGIVLIIIAWWNPGAWYAGIAMAMGGSLLCSGIMGLMMKPSSGSSVDSDEENSRSYIFSGALNTTRQGNPVFVAYGKHLLGSQVVSAALTTSDIPIEED